MLILLLFAFLSGLVTIAAPCIWPLLPIVLSTSATSGHRKPLGITLGIMISFAVFTLAISYIVKIIPFDTNILRLFAVVVIGILGLSLIIPAFSARLESIVSRLSGSLGSGFSGQKNDGFLPGLVAGLSLGLVWSPCAGPILATIATLAATRAVSFSIILVTIAYVVGIGIPLFIFSYFGQKFITKSRFLSPYTGRIQQVFGVIMILTAIAIFTNFDKALEANLLNSVPSYSNFLNQLEGNPQVTNQLNELKGGNSGFNSTGANLENLGPAPEFAVISNWLNSSPLTMSSLKGKVVLVDFWTYTCINCIRTLPFVTSWYEKYKDQGFVVVGVHTPEFQFEHDTGNVEAAIKQYNIQYPVAQDNDYATWNAYNNEYWPAEYLIDANGNVRHTSFGEGEYDQTETDIKTLLQEKGAKVDPGLVSMPDQTPETQLTPETYVGLSKIERFASKETPKLGNQTFTLSPTIDRDNWGFSGSWNLTPEYAQTTSNSGLSLYFSAGKVFLVITPQTNQDQIDVLLDGKPIASADSGNDVKNGKVILDDPRLYTLVNLQGRVEDHTLTLNFHTPGTKAFAFTFGD